MIHLFNRKELTVVLSDQRLFRLTEALANAGIPYQTRRKGASVFTADRYRGMPFVNSDVSHQYSIYVNQSDYDRAKAAIQSV